MNNPPSPASLKARKESLQRGERLPARAFRIEKHADGTISRAPLNPENQREKSAKAWDAETEVAKVRLSLNLSQEAFADLLGVSVSILRYWAQGKREPSGATRMLIPIALKHTEVLEEAVA